MWGDIKNNSSEELKVSPIAMIPHKSRAFRVILDPSFSIRLASGHEVPLVNEFYVKTVPSGASNQLGVGKCPVWGKPEDRLGPVKIATGSQTG